MDNIHPAAAPRWRDIFWPAQGKAAVAALLIASFAIHFWRLGDPSTVVFDESLVGAFSHAYLTGQYVFDIHPPHMKLAYAGLGWLFGMPSTPDLFTLGRPYPGGFYMAMRALPALLGALIPWAAFGLARQLGCSRAWAFAVAGLLLFDTALTASSQLILNDIPMLFCAVSGWWAFALWRSGGPRFALALSALLLAGALGVKWTALAFFLPPLVVLARDAWRGQFKRSLRAACAIGAIVFVHQGMGYAAHFSLLDRPGPGLAFMSPTFQEDFASKGAPSLSEPGRLFLATAELNLLMGLYAGRVPSHPYGSSWDQWPTGRKAIYAWTNDSASKPARIYFQPNLASWWPGTLGVAALALGLLMRPFSSRARKIMAGPQAGFLALAWAANWLPFALIGRVMFIYHYYPALVISIVAFAWMASRLRAPKWAAIAVVAASGAMFVWLSPWAYGIPLSEAAHQARQAFAFWP